MLNGIVDAAGGHKGERDVVFFRVASDEAFALFVADERHEVRD